MNQHRAEPESWWDTYGWPFIMGAAGAGSAIAAALVLGFILGRVL